MNLDDVGGSVTVSHAAALSRLLPFGSLVLEKIDPKSRYTETDWLLLGILNSLHEKPIDPFKPTPDKTHMSMSIEELQAVLSKPRREVGHGN